MAAEYAGLVRSCRHHSAVSAAPHQQRFAAKSRIVQLFDGRKKSIHVDVEDNTPIAQLAFPFPTN
jgi:hypothetical protein